MWTCLRKQNPIKLRRRQENNFKINVWEVGFVDIYWIKLAQDSD